MFGRFELIPVLWFSETKGFKYKKLGKTGKEKVFYFSL